MKFIPRLKPYYDYRELASALIPSSGDIEKFEKQFATKFECSSGVMFSYGRSGLYALFKVWGLQDSEIICPAYTCVVVPHAIVMSGNTPVFVDCEKGSFNMNYNGIEQAITAKTRAIVVTHLFGYPMDVHRIKEMVQKAGKKYGRKIYVIQDVAHSFGARWQGELVTKFGDAAIFGLNISKILNTIFGGMVLTNDSETYKKLVQFRQNECKKQGIGKTVKRFLYLIAVYFAFNSYIYGFVNWLERKGFLDGFVKYYDEGEIDFPKDWNHRPTELEARVGLVQLKKYDAIIEKRIQKAKEYIKEFQDRAGIDILPYTEGATYSHVVALVDDRKKWIEDYCKNGIQLGILIEYAIPYMKAYRKYARGEYAEAKYYAGHMINFPNWP